MDTSQNSKNTFVDTVKILIENWNRASIMQGAAEMAYFLLLSLVPILLVLANVIPLLPYSPQEAINLIESTFPSDISTFLVPIVRDYLQSSSGGAISIGLLASIWSASKVFGTLGRVLDEVYGATQKKNFIITRLLSLLVMITILFIVILAVFTFVFGEQILNFVGSFLEMDIPFLQEFLVLRWVLFPVILIVVTTVIYHLVPNHHLKIKYAVPGAVFTTFALILLSQFFTIISKYLGGDAVTNQTIGGFIVLMLFLYVANVLILLGALINTFTYEIINGQSVMEYENELREKELREETNWGGYPDESEVVLLKRKIYKVR